MYCARCGRELDYSIKFCYECGKEVIIGEDQKNSRMPEYTIKDRMSLIELVRITKQKESESNYSNV